MIPYDAMIPASRDLLLLLNLLLHGVHLSLIGFLLAGWAVAEWRPLHLSLLTLVWVSWLVVGLLVGHLGYCPLTDWHWQIKRTLGESGLPSSYIAYLYVQATGGEANDVAIKALTAVSLVLATAANLWLRLQDAVKSAGKTADV